MSRCRHLAAAVLILSCAASARAAVFQYRVDAETERGTADAFLWLPPQSQQIRGVVMSGMTLIEREMSRDPRVRAVCAEQDLAIVFLRTGLGAVDVQKVLDQLAEASGYRELSHAPLFFAGHSAGGPPAKNLAIRFADRCFGLMQFRGGVPGPPQPVPPGIPTLTMVGQFDEFGIPYRDEDGREGAWERPRDNIRDYRAADPGHLASLAVEPGAGHFAWSEANSAYFALFLGKAARARIPASWPIDATEPPELLAIDPTTGWLTDLDLRADTVVPAAAFADYTGDRTRAAWHFDQEMAEATVAFHRGITGRKDQFIRWRDRFWVDAGVRHFFTSPTWVDDGQTVRVHPEYADRYPERGWPALAGQPAGNAGTPIRLMVVGGPMVVTGPDTLRVQYSNVAPAGDRGRMTFMAYSEGNQEYRRTEMIGMMPRGFSGFNRGQEQTLEFPPLEDVKADHGPFELRATSSADLPVEFYVAHGPAEVVDGNLVIREIPARATFPIHVQVVAWQFGRGTEPHVRTAEPVARDFRILAP